MILCSLPRCNEYDDERPIADVAVSSGSSGIMGIALACKRSRTAWATIEKHRRGYCIALETVCWTSLTGQGGLSI